MKPYERWIDRAKSSYELSTLKVSKNIYFEDLCFQVQQAVEKGLKGLLIYYGVEPKFTHNIEILLEELEKSIDIPENIKRSSELTIYAVKTRYPSEDDGITREDYEESVKIAKECLDWIENKIREDKK
jgi:HEPN domain-containing protein